MSADTRGIRELAEQFWDSPEGQLLLKSIELPMDTTESEDDRLIGTTFASAFAESIVEQCCKEICSLCRDGVELDEDGLHTFENNIWGCAAAAIRSRWQRNLTTKGELKMKYDIEAISAKVHEQWMESKRAKGVTSRKLESGEELMVPYAELSEDAKELDRGSVMAVIRAMEAM